MADKKISQLSAASTPLAGTEVLPIVQSSATVKVATNDLTVRNVRANATTGILQVTGPTAASTRVMTVPDANFTAARTDAAQTFTGVNTFTSPKVITSIDDTNGNELFKITATASAVNELTVANAATGNNPVVSATGTDTNIGVTITPKGTGNTTLTTGNLVPATAGKGIDFSANTGTAGMTSELFNWYEEGTWTPADGSGAGLAFSNLSGNCYYTRVGNLVTCIFNITFPITASVVSCTISGLPFTSKSTTNAVAGGFFTYSGSTTPMTILVATAASQFVLYQFGGTNVLNVDLSNQIIRGVITYIV